MTMIRYCCALLLLGTGVSLAQTLEYATPTAREGTTLTAEALLWAGYRLDPHADPKARALDYLRVREVLRYSSNMHDPAAIEAEAAVVEGEIAQAVAQVNPAMRYTLDLTGLIDQIDGRKARVQSMLGPGLYGVETNFGSNSRYLPPLYELLLANMDHFQYLEVDAAVATELSELLRDIGPQRAHLRVELELVALQQGHRFQTIVRSMQWYRDVGHRSLLAQAQDKRNAQSLIRKRMLSEGVTFEVAPEHAYIVADERMLEVLVENQNQSRPGMVCKDQPRERGHRVIDCTWRHEYVADVYAYTTYRFVGGRRVEVWSIYDSAEPVTQAQQENIWHTAQYNHMGPINPGITQKVEWTYGSSRFMYDGKTLLKPDRKTPFYRVTALPYLDLQAGLPGTEVVP